MFNWSSTRLGAWLATIRDVPERYSFSSSYESKHNFTYFWFEYSNGALRRFIVTQKPLKQGLVGSGWINVEEQAVPLCIPYKLMGRPVAYDIRRVIGPLTIEYKSVWKFIFATLLRAPYRKLSAEKRAQRLFANSFRFSAERMDVLQRIVDWRRASGANTGLLYDFERDQFSHVNLLSEMFSIRIWGLAEKDKYLAELKFVMNSLAETGELKKVDTNYSLTPRALETLSKFEESNRVHDDAVSHNRWIKFLTVVIAGAATLQAAASLFGAFNPRE